MTLHNKKRGHGPVGYDSSNHVQVLCQRLGSTWPRVLPFCVANVLLMIILRRAQKAEIADFSISAQGHTFAALIVSFLIVSRINTAIARYSECRGYIGVMYREARELIQNMLVYSRRNRNNNVSSKEWRMEVAYRMMMLLRTSVAVIEFPSHQIAAWEVPELSGSELEYVRPSESWNRHTQVDRNRYRDSMRVPLLVAYLLRETIVGQTDRLTNPISPVHENKLMASVDSFLVGYYGMRKFMTTPVPFPLIQMTRTIVFFYVFSLPFVFLSDASKSSASNDLDQLVEHCMVIFLLTYGFIGLELVSIELDDPFGHDDNDFTGINYVGSNGELRGCHNDVKNMKEYIKNVHGFEEENITVLMDDGEHTEPTRDNILAAYQRLVAEAQPGDAVFCHYSGHGGKLRDDDGDEKDGYDETLIPVDYTSAGQIRDDDLYNMLVAGLKEGVFATFVMDCCHSGSVLDLPYTFVADGEETEMHLNQEFDFSMLMKLAAAFMAAQQAGQDPLGAVISACGGCTIS